MTTTERAGGGRPEKRRAILDGARKVFADEGFLGATIDGIAAEAGVSTRTIYKHFADKAQLFEAVLLTSSGVAEAHIALMDRHLSDLHDTDEVESALVAFALAWVSPDPEHRDHWRLVRQVNAESRHIPQRVIDAWQAAGPLRVLGELARRLQQLSEAGLLAVDDPDRAANHFARLVAAPQPNLRGAVPPPDEIELVVITGVHAFLHGYLA